MLVQPGWRWAHHCPHLLLLMRKPLRCSCSGPRREPWQFHHNFAPLLSCNTPGVEVPAVLEAVEEVLQVLGAVAVAVGAAHRIHPVLEVVARLRRSSLQVPGSTPGESASQRVSFPLPYDCSNR